jgi:uncharacterized protein (DUF169 family)
MNGCGNRRDFRGNSTRSGWKQAAWYSSEANVPRKNWRWKNGDGKRIGKNWKQKISAAVKLPRRAVGVGFLDAVPAGVEKFEGTEPSGCSFWRLAAAGKSFYTLPENHFNCAVGAYTHNIPLSAAREQETEQTLKMMFDLGYVKPEEVPRIPRLAKTPVAIVYAPLGDATFEPDAVLFTCRPAEAMLLNEASGRAGICSGAPTLGRPTCRRCR